MENESLQSQAHAHRKAGTLLWLYCVLYCGLVSYRNVESVCAILERERRSLRSGLEKTEAILYDKKKLCLSVVVINKWG